jgi:hypothetical protein
MACRRDSTARPIDHSASENQQRETHIMLTLTKALAGDKTSELNLEFSFADR